jgi:hypothetical protein
VPRWAIFLVAGLVPLIVLLAVGGIATSGGGDNLGRMPIPGKKKFTLDPGEVTVHYEEGRNYPDDQTMIEPPDFRVRVTDAGGDRVRLRRASGSVSETQGETRRAVYSFDVEERSTYTVRAAPTLRRAPGQQVTLGEDEWDLFKPWLIRAGIGSLAGLALAAAIVGLLALRARPA